MGQPMTAMQQQFLRKHPAVRCVTAEHITLKTGEVLDPSEFACGGRRLFLIRKLRRCGCDVPRHKPGLHIVVEVTGQQTILGTVVGPIAHLHPCLHGDWTTEETISEEEARSSGLLRVVDEALHLANTL